jgi:hypothetical protein
MAALLILLAWAGAGAAATALFAPSKDNTLYESATGDLSNGAGDLLFAGRTNPTTDLIQRAVLAFDVAGQIPLGSVINSASLALTVTDVVLPKPDASFSIHALLSDWGEGISDIRGDESDGAPAAEGDATWLHTFYPDEFWATEGGDFDAVASASVVVGGAGPYTWDGLAGDVQFWVDNRWYNFGWILIGDEGASASARPFASRAYPILEHRPMLMVDYTPPPEGTLALAVGANQPQFGTGDTLDLSLSAANPGLQNTADVYVVVLFPDGETLINFVGLDGALEIGSLADVGALTPMLSSLPLAGAFDVSLSPFFSYTWIGLEPAGDYSAFLLMTEAGSLSDGSLDPEDLLQLSSTDFSFDP